MKCCLVQAWGFASILQNVRIQKNTEKSKQYKKNVLESLKLLRTIFSICTSVSTGPGKRIRTHRLVQTKFWGRIMQIEWERLIFSVYDIEYDLVRTKFPDQVWILSPGPAIRYQSLKKNLALISIVKYTITKPNMNFNMQKK